MSDKPRSSSRSHSHSHVAFHIDDQPDEKVDLNKKKKSYAGPGIDYLSLDDPRVTPVSDSCWPHFLQWPLFFFPYNVNEHVVRVVGFFNFALAILVIVARNERWAHYISALMFADYCLRFLFGARASFLGAFSECFVFWLKPKFIDGPSKQFASLCGALFTGGATLAFFLEEATPGDGIDGQKPAAATLMAILMFCAFLESVFNFCVGCFCYRIGLNIVHLLEQSTKHASATLDETVRTYDELNNRLNEGSSLEHIIIGKEGKVKNLPLRYTYATDAQKRENFHLIKQFKVSYFSLPMSLVGLTLCWYFASRQQVFFQKNQPYQILSILSAVFYGLFIIIFTMKALLYPRKIQAEWQNPVARNFFVTIPLTLLLFVPLAASPDFSTEHEHVFAQVLFWIGAPLQLLFTIFTLGFWLTRPNHPDSFTPAYFLPALANIVSGVMLPFCRPDFAEGAWLWLAFGIFMWVVLTTLVFQRIMFRVQLDERVRSSLFMLFAAPALICVAYTGIVNAFDNFSCFAYYVSLVFFLINVFLIAHAYFGRDRFNMGYWGYAFPLDCLCLASLVYYAYRPNNLTEGIATTALAIVSCTHAIFMANTVLALLDRKIFTSDDKWNPQSMWKIQHYAFAEVLNQMQQLLKSPFNTSRSVDSLRSYTDAYITTLLSHGAVEDHIIFPHFEHLYPGVTSRADAQHDKLDAELETLRSQVDALCSLSFNDSNRAQAVTNLLEFIDAHAKFITQHMLEEEKLLNPLGRKYFNTQLSIDIVRKAWASVPIDQWRVILPFSVQFQFIYARQVRFIQCLRWAVPEQMGVIAKILYENLPELTYQRLVVDIPELAVRNAHWRYQKIW